MGCQQGTDLLNDKLMLKQLTLKTAAFLTILGGRQIHTLHMLSVIHMDRSPDKVIFYIIGLRKCSKPTRPNQPIVYRAYMEEELPSQRSKIITQNFNEFFITFGKPHHPASKDSLA